MAVTSLIVGLVPVTVPLLGRNTSGAIPLRRMLAPMALILAGIVLINIHALTTAPEGSQSRYLLGVLLAVLAVAAPAARFVPIPVLSAVLMVVAYNMGEWKELPHMLRLPKSDVAVWATTFALTVAFDQARLSR